MARHQGLRIFRGQGTARAGIDQAKRERDRVEDLQAHCCGMAGSWGMAARNYDLSRAIGSDLIGKLGSSPSTFGVTDCPTCRMQMEEFSRKPVRHPVEIIAEHLVR